MDTLIPKNTPEIGGSGGSGGIIMVELREAVPNSEGLFLQEQPCSGQGVGHACGHILTLLLTLRHQMALHATLVFNLVTDVYAEGKELRVPLPDPPGFTPE